MSPGTFKQFPKLTTNFRAIFVQNIAISIHTRSRFIAFPMDHFGKILEVGKDSIKLVKRFFCRWKIGMGDVGF